MATFVYGQPANGSKIRNYPELARNNFDAIKDGDPSFAATFFNLEEQASAPGDEADNIRLYGAAGTNYTSLFAHNENGDDIQITDDDYLGGPAQKLNLVSMKFGTTTYGDGTTDVVNTQSALVTAWGRFTAAGATIAAYNCTSSAATGGRYTITFDNDMNNANYLVVPSVRATGGSYESRSINVVPTATITYSVSQFGVVIRTQGGSPSETTAEFGIVVYGGL